VLLEQDGGGLLVVACEVWTHGFPCSPEDVKGVHVVGATGDKGLVTVPLSL
jgi:hypothetical protein